MFMIGLSILLLMTMNLKNSTARQGISLSIAITMLGLASLGYYEFFKGMMNQSIFTAIGIELFTGFSFLITFFINLKSNKEQL